jgi:hypothetical protein
VFVGVLVGVPVKVDVGVFVGVPVGVPVGVAVGVLVGGGVGVPTFISSRTCPTVVLMNLSFPKPPPNFLKSIAIFKC